MTERSDIIDPDGLTIPELFKERAQHSPEKPAYHFFDRTTQKWLTRSWQQTEAEIALWRTALCREKLVRGERVAVMLPNCLEWVCIDLAAMSLGLVVVPLYANDRPDNIAYIIEQTEARVLLCSGPVYRDHLRLEKERLGSLQRIILVDETSVPADGEARVSPLSAWLPATTAPVHEAVGTPDDLATIVYTSGTTGPPKGVMLSHRNILENVKAGLHCSRILPSDLFLSFLPLSHMLERTAGYYLPMMAGSSVAFARSIQELSDDMATLKPTVLVAVPRIFERIYSKLSINLSRESALRRSIFKAAVDIGWAMYQYRQYRGNWSPGFLLHPLLDTLVGRKLREKLGGQLRVVISGGAPLSFEVARTLIGLGIDIFQGYGLTEASPIISVNRIGDNRPSGVGPLLPGIEARIGEHGELLIRGPNVMLGYWKNPAATTETIDPNGWLRTGDTAIIEEGHVRITGRLKEILVLSNGEKICPSDVETAIAADPLFEQNLVVGEGRPYLTVLAVLNPELWKQLAAKLGQSPDETSLNDETVRRTILERIERSMKNFPGFAWIRDIHLSLKPWTIDQGFLTPTMKLRRKNILSALNDEVERMYQV